MDGITRNGGDLDAELIEVLAPGLLVVALGLVAMLVFALVVELLRRAGRAPVTVERLDRILPTTARRFAAAALGLTVSLLGPASAAASDAPVRDWLAGTTTTTSTPPSTSTSTTTTRTLRPGPVATADALDERAASPSTVPVVPAPPPVAPTTSAPALVVVVEGDCLWSIAADRLGPDATNPAIDRAWRAIYTANRDAIGDDPNLIFPGLELALPPIDPSPYAAP
jgi:nucleoid-associated protein YgaU